MFKKGKMGHTLGRKALCCDGWKDRRTFLLYKYNTPVVLLVNHLVEDNRGCE